MSKIIPHQDWEDEKKETEGNPGWSDDLLKRVAATLGTWGNWADKVGKKKDEIQIQFVDPINSLFSYKPLGLLWVQFNTYDPVTKKPSTRVVRFGPDTTVLIVLVKSGKNMFLLARRKYQLAAKEHMNEFSRGWVKGAMANDQGWKLFERDLPGLKGNPVVSSISEKNMGSPIWENDAEHANKISYHLVVVTLKEDIGKDDLGKMLTRAKLEQEYPNENADDLSKDDLKSQPVVFEIEKAAKFLNAHVTGKEAPLALFGEDFSQKCWTKFLAIYGRQFSNLLPEQGELI